MIHRYRLISRFIQYYRYVLTVKNQTGTGARRVEKTKSVESEPYGGSFVDERGNASAIFLGVVDY